MAQFHMPVYEGTSSAEQSQVWGVGVQNPVPLVGQKRGPELNGQHTFVQYRRTVLFSQPALGIT